MNKKLMIVGILFNSPFLKAQDIPKEYFDLVKKEQLDGITNQLTQATAIECTRK